MRALKSAAILKVTLPPAIKLGDSARSGEVHRHAARLPGGVVRASCIIPSMNVERAERALLEEIRD